MRSKNTKNFLLLFPLLLRSAPAAQPFKQNQQLEVHVQWDRPAGVGVSRTTTTLQVVTNPILDRVFSNGVPNPIHAAAWGSLRNLSANYVRFVPW